LDKRKRTLPADPDRRGLVDSLRLLRSRNVGPMTFHALLDRFGSATDALDAIGDLSRLGGRRAPITVPAREAVEAELAAADAVGARPLVHGRPDYPAWLGAVADAPPVLYALGETSLLHRPAVAMVGARNASAAGARFARTLASELGHHDVVVISGLARGIDTAAHRGALATGTVAVLAGGVDHVYPPENEGLHADIAAQGCVLSEMPPGTVPRAQLFPRRNRLVAGLARCVVVVEGAARSGSLITARLAADYGRDVLAVPGSPLDPRARGPNALIRQGAALCETVDDVLTVMDVARTAERPNRPADVPESPCPAPCVDERTRNRVVDALSATPTELDDIARTCDSAAQDVSAVILELELAGRVQRLPGHRVQLLR